MRRSIRPLMTSLAAAALGAAWLLAVAAASAQTESPQTQSPSQSQSPSPGPLDQSPNIPDQKLDAAATALARMTSLREGYQQQLAAAPPSDRKQIADEANNALAKAVTDQGLSIEEYTSILQVAQNVPEVREKLLDRARRSMR
jgi:Domain of unknown function (DUF4168)